MTMTDPIADMLTRIRNANVVLHDEVRMPSSKQKVALAKILQREGYIRGYSWAEQEETQAEFTIELKYHDGAPVIKEISRVSTPGRRVYSRIKDLQKVYGGLGISILSTPRRVMSDSEARAANVGGEVLCRVF